MPSSAEVFSGVRGILGSVPDEDHEFVCPYCLGPVPGYPRCASCNHLFHRNGAPRGLGERIVPITTALNPSPWYTHLSGYKGLRPEYGLQLIAVFVQFLAAHEDEIEELLGGEISLITVVPSTRGVDFEDQPLAKVLKLSHGMKKYVHQTLAHVEDQDIGRGQYRPEAFRPTGANVKRERVLLVEDLWVSGAKSVSAAGSILEAGAESLVLMPIAREIRDNEFFCPREYLQAMEVPFELDAWPRG